ncbi:protein WHAT'S THIS FACTOR 9, mitochondrial-like [Cornus florida]|uniref:protein WHAT'S THIS FACTOR 9, mitochondrial-like n=1 Tax=Cornus florida TaxID=4283 RepID=UPI0028969A59|nr:protein WHAT'S THIS FACTOR 9, mitochondrial-like [Cornus florida]
MGFNHEQKANLVNVKLKWVKDRVLDAVVVGDRDLRAASILVSIISANPHCCLPVYHLSHPRGQLSLPHDLKISTFMRRYPTIFDEFHVRDSGGTRVPWFRLTPKALDLHQEELGIYQNCEMDLLDRLRKLLMLTKDRILPLQTIDQLKWDIGLPFDYPHSLIPHHPDISAALQQREKDVENGSLAFPIGFTRGFGLKRKCMEWLEEWRRLPYTSPYSDASHLDPRTDVPEKRIVGVFHELLHLTIQKKTERKNVSNLRKPLALPQKFTNVFERHPGIFYISRKCDTQTVVLREAYDRHQLIQRHPLVDNREKFESMMKEGFLDRSRGLYKRNRDAVVEEDRFRNVCSNELSDNGFKNEGESDDSDCNFLSEYESDETIDDPC